MDEAPQGAGAGFGRGIARQIRAKLVAPVGKGGEGVGRGAEFCPQGSIAKFFDEKGVVDHGRRQGRFPNPSHACQDDKLGGIGRVRPLLNGGEAIKKESRTADKGRGRGGSKAWGRPNFGRALVDILDVDDFIATYKIAREGKVEVAACVDV